MRGTKLTREMNHRGELGAHVAERIEKLDTVTLSLLNNGSGDGLRPSVNDGCSVPHSTLPLAEAPAMAGLREP